MRSCCADGLRLVSLYADDAAEGFVLAAEHYADPEPVNLGTAQRSRSATSPRHRKLTGFSGSVVWDTSMPNDSRARHRCLESEECVRLHRKHDASRGTREHTIACIASRRFMRFVRRAVGSVLPGGGGCPARRPSAARGRRAAHGSDGAFASRRGRPRPPARNRDRSALCRRPRDRRTHFALGATLLSSSVLSSRQGTSSSVAPTSITRPSTATMCPHRVWPHRPCWNRRGLLAAASGVVGACRHAHAQWLTAASPGAGRGRARRPRVWPALAAPVLAALVMRRPVALAATIATAGLGLAALAVFPARASRPARLAPGANARSVREYRGAGAFSSTCRWQDRRRRATLCSGGRSSLLPCCRRDPSTRATDRPDDVPARDRRTPCLLAARGEHLLPGAAQRRTSVTPASRSSAAPIAHAD